MSWWQVLAAGFGIVSVFALVDMELHIRRDRSAWPWNRGKKP